MPQRITWVELLEHPWTGYIVADAATGLTRQLRLALQPLLGSGRILPCVTSGWLRSPPTP